MPRLLSTYRARLRSPVASSVSTSNQVSTREEMFWSVRSRLFPSFSAVITVVIPAVLR